MKNTTFKFTQSIKDKWLSALKSGDYIQGQHTLVRNVNNKTYHCCIGVLGEVIPELDNKVERLCPYVFLEETIGNKKTNELWVANDKGKLLIKDYSNVIPLIEKLEVSV